MNENALLRIALFRMIAGSARTGGQFTQSTGQRPINEIQKMKTLCLVTSISRSRLRCGFFILAMALCWFALSPALQAGCPSPPGACAGQNTAVGEDALFNVDPTTTGKLNVAVGFRALFNDTTGNQNTGIGYNALFSNVSGQHSTAIGGQALYSNITGNDNVGVGFNTLYNNTDGNRNTGMGYRTLAFNASGDDNTAIGWNALYNNRATASNNTATGSQALFTNIAGVDDTAVGFQAMQFNVSAFTNAAVGTFAMQNNDSSAAGSAVFNTAVGGFALKTNVDGTRNTAVGAGAIESGDGGNDNTAVGELAGNDITGNSNTCLGSSAGSNLTSGEGNIYIGAQVHAGSTGEFEFIRIGNDTAFTFPYDTFIAGIQNRAVSAAANPHFVLVDDNGKLGTVSLNEIGIKTKQPQTVPQRVQPRAIGPDPKQAMLNRKVEKLQATVAQQQKEIETLTAQLKEQAAQIQKVSAQLETSKPAPRVVNNP
jgi:hypothetical protein